MRSKLLLTGASIAVLLGGAACTTTDPYSSTPRRNNTATGALAGALGGAVLGYLTNTSNSEEGRKNALIGAGIGA
ncbi:MAG TPA: YMGG-like glycine zipper-containing protein, partial [Brevundimonas sp.]